MSKGPFELGFAHTALRQKLVSAVLGGTKTATSSLRDEYTPAGTDELPNVGERFTLLGYDDEALGVVETTEVTVVPIRDVDRQFARDEGEGFDSVAQWRAAHEHFWAPLEINNDTLVVCERFRLVERF